MNTKEMNLNRGEVKALNAKIRKAFAMMRKVGYTAHMNLTDTPEQEPKDIYMWNAEEERKYNYDWDACTPYYAVSVYMRRPEDENKERDAEYWEMWTTWKRILNCLDIHHFSAFNEQVWYLVPSTKDFVFVSRDIHKMKMNTHHRSERLTEELQDELWDFAKEQRDSNYIPNHKLKVELVEKKW